MILKVQLETVRLILLRYKKSRNLVPCYAHMPVSVLVPAASLLSADKRCTWGIGTR
jgi:hypothetical protein